MLILVECDLRATYLRFGGRDVRATPAGTRGRFESRVVIDQAHQEFVAALLPLAYYGLILVDWAIVHRLVRVRCGRPDRLTINTLQQDDKTNGCLSFN